MRERLDFLTGMLTAVNSLATNSSELTVKHKCCTFERRALCGAEGGALVGQDADVTCARCLNAMIAGERDYLDDIAEDARSRPAQLWDLTGR